MDIKLTVSRATSVLIAVLVIQACTDVIDSSWSGPADAQVLFGLDRGSLVSNFPLGHPTPSAFRRQFGQQLPQLKNPLEMRAIDEINALANNTLGGTLGGGLLIGFSSAPNTDNWPQSPTASVLPASGLQLWELSAHGVATGKRVPFVWHYDESGGAYHDANNLRVVPEFGFSLEPNGRYAFVILEGYGVNRSPEQEHLLARDPAAKILFGEQAYADYVAGLEDLNSRAIVRDKIAFVQVWRNDDPANELRGWLESAILLGPQPVRNMEETRLLDQFCLIEGEISMPQFQQGVPLFYPDGGQWTGLSDGTLVEMNRMWVPFSITLPRIEMPSNGWPLNIFIHGTAGLHTQIADRGRTKHPDGHPEENLGPGYVFALQGMAGAGAALPINPEREPDGLGWGFYNFFNIPAFIGNFRQSAVEQSMLLSTLLELEIPPSNCVMTNGNGQARPHFFRSDKVSAMGQSLGALVLMLWQNFEPRVGAIIPSGAGAWYSELLATSTIIPGELLLQLLTFVNDSETINPLHPMALWLQATFESVDPLATASRISRRPYIGASAKHVYMPAGYLDGFFHPGSINALAGPLGVEFNGSVVEDSLRAMLERRAKETDIDGDRITAVIEQFGEDGILDGHHVSYQLDAVKTIYNCFLRSYFDEVKPTVFSEQEIFADGGLSCP